MVTDYKPTYDQIAAELHRASEHLQAIEAANDRRQRLVEIRFSWTMDRPDWPDIHHMMDEKVWQAECDLRRAITVPPWRQRRFDGWHLLKATDIDGWENEGGALPRDAE